MRQQGQSLLITTGKVWREGYGWEITFLVAALTGFLFFFFIYKGDVSYAKSYGHPLVFLLYSRTIVISTQSS